MIDLQAMQGQHAEWAERKFPSHTPYDSLIGAMGELGELAQQFLKSQWGNNESTRSEAMEAADVIIFLMGYCSKRSINLEWALCAKFAEVMAR
jgi:NTP pyrophosphatase (non-canonical NTP hydrolase)